MDSEKKRKIKIITLSILLAVVIVSISVFSIITISNSIKSKNAVEPTEPSTENSGTSIFSNSYNEAISKKILTTYNYSGTYVYDETVYVLFNEYSESNPTGLTTEEINQIMIEKGCTNLERNEFRKIIDSEKYLSTENETIVIDTPINSESGSNENYGYYTINSSSGTTRGYVYGDENLAVIVKDNDETVYTFISLNYKKMSEAISVSESTETLDGKIYIFENTYDSNGRLLYSVTYTYKAIKS